ncbi:MAG: hypothetical protein ACEQSB_02530 [Undibacterium sp.]
MNRIIPYLARHKEFIGTSTAVITALLLLAYLGDSTDVSPVLQSFITYVGVFLVIPVLYCKILLGRPLSSLGFQKGNIWAGVGGSILALSVALAALFVLWNFTPLLKDYQLPRAVEEKFLIFVLYEVFVNGFITLLYETFFRGFIMLLWLRNWGIWSVFFQAGLFFLLVYLSNGFSPETIPILLFAPFAGLIAYQARSVWFSYGASWLFFFFTDALILIFR